MFLLSLFSPAMFISPNRSIAPHLPPLPPFLFIHLQLIFIVERQPPYQKVGKGKTYCARPSYIPAPSDQKTNTYPLPPSPPPSASLPSTFPTLSLSAPSFEAHYRAQPQQRLPSVDVSVDELFGGGRGGRGFSCVDEHKRLGYGRWQEELLRGKKEIPEKTTGEEGRRFEGAKHWFWEGLEMVVLLVLCCLVGVASRDPRETVRQAGL